MQLALFQTNGRCMLYKVRYITCNVKLQIQSDLVGQGGVSEQLVGLFQGALLRGDAVDGQQSVPHLQQPTPSHRPQAWVTQGHNTHSYWTQMFDSFSNKCILP